MHAYMLLCMKTIKQLIGELRTTGVTQQSIAAMTGVSQPTVSRWASGRTLEMDYQTYDLLNGMLELKTEVANDDAA